jgi:hypothetical protein
MPGIRKKKNKKLKNPVYQKYVPIDKGDYVSPQVYRRPTRDIPSHMTMSGNTDRKDSPKYTGGNLIGIATMHKSNLVPVFKGQDAIDIARMRRN